MADLEGVWGVRFGPPPPLRLKYLIFMENFQKNQETLINDLIIFRALTRILKKGVQDSHLAKSRSPTPKKLESHQYIFTICAYRISFPF